MFRRMAAVKRICDRRRAQTAKIYVKPNFYAENYQITDSIAACNGDQQISVQEKLTVEIGKAMCPVGDKGHFSGKGFIPASEYPLTLFNDGKEKTDCKYDWNGKGDVYGPDGKPVGSFGKAFYGAEAQNDNHRPAYDQKVFFS